MSGAESWVVVRGCWANGKGEGGSYQVRESGIFPVEIHCELVWFWGSLKGKVLSSLGLGVEGARWFSDNRVYAGTPGLWGLECSGRYSSL